MVNHVSRSKFILSVNIWHTIIGSTHFFTGNTFRDWKCWWPQWVLGLRSKEDLINLFCVTCNITQTYMFSKCMLRYDVVRVFESSLVLVFVRVILSWWHVYIVCNTFCLNVSLIYIVRYFYGVGQTSIVSIPDGASIVKVTLYLRQD